MTAKREGARCQVPNADMLRAAIVGVVILSLPQLGIAQDASDTKYTISGFVTDAESGETLPSAHIYDIGRRIGTVTNAFGFYSLTLPADSVTLVVSYLGFAEAAYGLLLTEDMKLDVSLIPVDVLADNLIIIAERTEPIEQSVRMSTTSIPISEVRSLPAVLGEVDLLRSLQLLPGVQSGGEAASGLFVRGGSGDQTLLLLDGARVYNAYHLFGFYSVFNADALKHVELTKGGFPARYGGTLASVVEVGMKEGNTKRYSADAAIGVVSAKAIFEGPIMRDKASFIVSGRRTFLDLIARPFMEDDEVTTFGFYDVNAKVNAQVAPNDRLYFSVYHGRDGFSYREQSPWEYRAYLKWGNVTSTFRWNHVFGDKLFGNLTVTASDYEFETGFDEREGRTTVVSSDYISGIREFGMKVDMDYSPSSAHYIRFGGQAKYHRFNSGAVRFSSPDDQGVLTNLGRNIFYGTRGALYAEDDITFSEQLKVNVGLRLSSFAITNRLFTALEPRLSIRYLLAGGWALKGSYARMQQYIFLLRNSGVALPTDLWLPSTSRVPPQDGHVGAVGVARSISGGRYELSIEGYYRTMDNAVEYENAARFLGISDDWQDKVVRGRGWAYGGELLLRKQAGRTTGWIGYTLAWAYRQFDELNNGNKFPYQFDRRHDVSVVVTHRVRPSIELSGIWTFATGSSISLPSHIYRGLSSVLVECTRCYIESYTSRNNYRLASYHRLDLGVNFIKRKNGREKTFSLGAYNAYNRKNPFFLYPSTDRNGKDVLKQVSLLPIVPYVTYRRTF